MPLDKKELEAIKADFGVGSRRLREIYNDNLGFEADYELCDAFDKADTAYEAMKRLLEKLE